MHDFPSSDQLQQQRLRLGELLLSWRAIDDTILAKALQAQADEHKPLGQILLEHGYLDEDTLNEAILFQRETGEPEPVNDSPAPAPTAKKQVLEPS